MPRSRSRCKRHQRAAGDRASVPAAAAFARAFAALGARPPSAFEQLRTLTERHARGADQVAAARRAARCAAQRRLAYRPEVPHARPISTSRPREGGARVVVASGRDGTQKRDDGSGSGSNGGGGDGDGGGSDPASPPSRSQHDDPGGAS